MLSAIIRRHVSPVIQGAHQNVAQPRVLDPGRDIGRRAGFPIELQFLEEPFVFRPCRVQCPFANHQCGHLIANFVQLFGDLPIPFVGSQFLVHELQPLSEFRGHYVVVARHQILGVFPRGAGFRHRFLPAVDIAQEFANFDWIGQLGVNFGAPTFHIIEKHGRFLVELDFPGLTVMGDVFFKGRAIADAPTDCARHDANSP